MMFSHIHSDHYGDTITKTLMLLYLLLTVMTEKGLMSANMKFIDS